MNNLEEKILLEEYHKNNRKKRKRKPTNYYDISIVNKVGSISKGLTFFKIKDP